MSETTDPIAIIPDSCPVCGERTCAVHLRPVSDPPRWFVKATSAMSLLLYGDPAKVDRVACAETIMNTLTAAALQAPAEVSRIEAACQERERHPLRVVDLSKEPRCPTCEQHPIQCICVPRYLDTAPAATSVKLSVTITDEAALVEAAGWATEVDKNGQPTKIEAGPGVAEPATTAALFGRVTDAALRRPGVAKVEPLTAFERLEAEIERMRTGHSRPLALLEAFDAWKVAREAEPDRERTPAPLTEAEAAAWAARLITEGSIAAQSAKVARALLAAARGDIPAAVRTLPLPGVEQPAAAIPRTLTREEAHALLVRGMGHSEDVAAGLLRNARTILAKGHAGDPDMPITELHAPLLHAALRAYVAWLDAQPEGLGPEPGMPKA